MWMFRGGLDWRLLEDRLSRMGLVSEWRVLGGGSVLSGQGFYSNRRPQSVCCGVSGDGGGE